MSNLEQREKIFSQGGISRHEFLARVLALGIALAASPALLSKADRAATPKKGGNFVHAVETFKGAGPRGFGCMVRRKA